MLQPADSNAPMSINTEQAQITISSVAMQHQASISEYMATQTNTQASQALGYATAMRQNHMSFVKEHKDDMSDLKLAHESIVQACMASVMATVTDPALQSFYQAHQEARTSIQAFVATASPTASSSGFRANMQNFFKGMQKKAQSTTTTATAVVLPQ